MSLLFDRERLITGTRSSRGNLSAILRPNIHSAYSVCVPSRGAPVSTPSNRLAGDRPVPDLVTEIPGPKARAHVAYDETWTSPSLPRAYPIVPVRGDGLTVEDIDGNLFLDFAAGIAVTSTGHAHPAVVARDQGAGRRPDPLQRQRLLPADLRRGLPADRRDHADRRRPGPGVPRQLRRGGRRGVDQARPATRRSGRTSSRSSAPSTAGPTARSR